MVYKPVFLNLDNGEIVQLMHGGAIKVRPHHLLLNGGSRGESHASGSRSAVTAPQHRRIENVSRGDQGSMTLTMSPAQVQHNVKNNSVWRNIWNRIKKGATHVGNTLIDVAGNEVTKQYQKKIQPHLAKATKSLVKNGIKYVRKRVLGKGARKYQHEVFNNMSSNGDAQNGLYNHDVFNTGSRNKHFGIHNNSVYNNGAHHVSGAEVDAELKRLGFTDHQIGYMKGKGIFKSIWKGVKGVGSVITPVIASKIMEKIGEAAFRRIMGGSIRFTRSQINHMHGAGFFGSIGSFLKDTFTKPSGILGVASMVPGPWSTPLKVAGIGAKMLGHGKAKRKTKRKTKGKNIVPVGSNIFPVGGHF